MIQDTDFNLEKEFMFDFTNADRTSSECKAIADEYVAKLAGIDGVKFDYVFKSCLYDSKFIPETPTLRRNALKTVVQSFETHRASFDLNRVYEEQ